MLKGDAFFPSFIIDWVAIYFVVAYMKLYLPDTCSKSRTSILLLTTGIFGIVIMQLTTNFLGLHVSAFENKMLRWNSLCNPFLLLIALGAFNVARKARITSWMINNLSALMIFVYLLHDGVIFRTYVRLAMLHYAFVNFGHEHLLLTVVMLSLLLFIECIIVAAIIKAVLSPVFSFVGDRLYCFIKKQYLKLESRMIINS